MENQKFIPSQNQLNTKIVQCRLCPRLVLYRETVPKRASFRHDTYWRKPVPGFGDIQAKILILGLAPAADGGNRTGRIFTGDPTGAFLLKALHAKGFANISTSHSQEDGLILKGVYLTAAVKCVPPQHRPLKEEFKNCSRYFENEFFLLKNLSAVLTLGQSAFSTYLSFLKKYACLSSSLPKFSHGVCYPIPGWPTLYASYHPSPQNTYTKILTEKMFASVLDKIKNDLEIK
jgi:uracil-DNA glycosylase